MCICMYVYISRKDSSFTNCLITHSIFLLLLERNFPFDNSSDPRIINEMTRRRRRQSKTLKRKTRQEINKVINDFEDKTEDLVIPETMEACLRSLDRELCCSIW